MKKILAIVLVLILTLSLLTACSSSGNTPSGNSNTPPVSQEAENTPPASQGMDGTPSGSDSVFVPDDKEHIITFQFEDEEHRQAVLAYLKTVLYAEDYYAFLEGEDYDVPYDFDNAESMLAEWHAAVEAKKESCK